jgi:hypothetical protein
MTEHKTRHHHSDDDHAHNDHHRMDERKAEPHLQPDEKARDHHAHHKVDGHKAEPPQSGDGRRADVSQHRDCGHQCKIFESSEISKAQKISRKEIIYAQAQMRKMWP